MPEQDIMDVVEKNPLDGLGMEEAIVPPTKPVGNSDPRMYTEDDLIKARQQEKEKLYRRIEHMQTELQFLQEEDMKRKKQEEEAAKFRAEQERLKAESEMSAKELIAQKEKEWREEQSRLRSEIEAERALREQETRFAELMEVRQKIMNEYSDRIAPELIDMVEGVTPDELRNSAEDLANRTSRILAQTQEAVQNARQQMPTARVTLPTASGTDEQGAVRQFTAEELRNMSMADYVKHRKGLLGYGAIGGPKNRGMFG